MSLETQFDIRRNGLYIKEQLEDLYNWENSLKKSLPSIFDEASSNQLKKKYLEKQIKSDRKYEGFKVCYNQPQVKKDQLSLNFNNLGIKVENQYLEGIFQEFNMMEIPRKNSIFQKMLDILSEAEKVESLQHLLNEEYKGVYQRANNYFNLARYQESYILLSWCLKEISPTKNVITNHELTKILSLILYRRSICLFKQGNPRKALTDINASIYLINSSVAYALRSLINVYLSRFENATYDCLSSLDQNISGKFKWLVLNMLEEISSLFEKRKKLLSSINLMSVVCRDKTNFHFYTPRVVSLEYDFTKINNLDIY